VSVLATKIVLQAKHARGGNEMFSRIRTATVVFAAAVTLSAGAMPAVSSALTVKQTLITVPAAKVIVKKGPVAAIKSAGSAGVPGYDDDTCESLLKDYETVNKQSNENLLNNSSSNQAGQLANQIYGQLTSNCLTVD
jgi:ribosome-interacting GTPase 1